MYMTIKTVSDLNKFMHEAGITKPDVVIKRLSDKNILVSPDIAKLILKAA